MKVSGAYLYGGGTPPHYAGASEAAKGYIKAAPERCVWGSDWPHPDATKKLNPVAMPDDVVLLNLLAEWAPDAKLRHRILVENPEVFYGFDPRKDRSRIRPTSPHTPPQSSCGNARCHKAAWSAGCARAFRAWP